MYVINQACNMYDQGSLHRATHPSTTSHYRCNYNKIFVKHTFHQEHKSVEFHFQKAAGCHKGVKHEHTSIILRVY